MILVRRVLPLILAVLMSGLASQQVFADAPVDFSIKGIDGKTYKLSDYRGKWVVVNYWASWCPPCLEEIPDLAEFHDKHKDKDAVVLGINTEDLELKALADFSESYLISYPVLRGSSDPYAEYNIGPIPAMPTTYIVSPEGKVLARNVGPLTGKMIEDFMAKACKKKQTAIC